MGQSMVASYDEPAILLNPQDGSIYANRHAAGLSHFFEGDVNKDGVVDLADFADIASDWLKCSNPQGAGCVNLN